MTPVTPVEPVVDTRYDRLIAYYEEAGPDFAQWSAAFNMLFGYYRAGLNPFRREPMLSELNRQVLDRLILERIQLRMGERAGVRISDDQLNEALNGMARQNGVTLEQFMRITGVRVKVLHKVNTQFANRLLYRKGHLKNYVEDYLGNPLTQQYETLPNPA